MKLVSLKKLIGSVVATLVAATMMVFGLVAPASASGNAGNGFQVQTTAGTAIGTGTLALVPTMPIPDPVTVKAVLSSGKFSNGSGTTTLTLQGTTPAQDTYACVGIGSTVSVFDPAGAVYTTVPVNVNGSSTTPCGGGAAAPPDPIVKQSASIAVVAGGTPIITFNSAGSNIPTDYQVLINGATDYPKVTVAADGSSKLTLPKQAPGTTIDVRVYGDGSGSGALLAHVVVAEAPVVTPPADNTNTVIVEGCHATGSATNPYVPFHANVNAFIQAGHEGHDDDIIKPGSDYIKQGVAGTVAAKNWDANGQAIFANGCEVVVTHEPPVEDHPTNVNVCTWVDGGYKAGVMSAEDIINQVGKDFAKFIIPRFVYTDSEGKWQQYDGQNWSTDNRVILGNGCKVNKPAPPASGEQPKPGDKPAPTTTSPDTSAPAPTQAQTPTQSVTVTHEQVVTADTSATTTEESASVNRGFTASTAAHEEVSDNGLNLWLLAGVVSGLMALWLLSGAVAPRPRRK